MKVGIIGAGTMGSGIAQTFAQQVGYEVMLCDLTAEIAYRGKTGIKNNLNKRVKKGKLSEEEAQVIENRIQTGTKQICIDCDLVIEAAVENMDIKRKTFQELDDICKKETIFATNTSSLSITEIGIGISHPFAGMHFFNPAPVMKLVEVIAGLHTEKTTVDAVMKVAEDIGKVPVEVKESPGFVVNRVLIPMINEAVGIYAEGCASAEGIDTAMKLGANLPMGPLELGDLVGLDVVLAIMEVLQSETGDGKYRPHPLLKKMVRGNLLGVKTKNGFYNY